MGRVPGIVGLFIATVQCLLVHGELVSAPEDLPGALSNELPHHVVLTEHMNLLQYESLLPGETAIELSNALRSFTVRSFRHGVVGRFDGSGVMTLCAPRTTPVTSMLRRMPQFE